MVIMVVYGGRLSGGGNGGCRWSKFRSTVVDMIKVVVDRGQNGRRCWSK